MKTTIRSLVILWLACYAIIMTSFGQENKQPTVWSIVASYSIPGKASGLAWNGTYIYFGIYGANGDQIYKFNPGNGTYSLQCTGSFGDAYGLTYKDPNLVTTDHVTATSVPATAIEFTMSGTTVSTLNLPDHYMSGIAYDAGNYWVCTYYPDPGTVYKINASGTVLSQFTPPNNQPWDICLQGPDLWIADYYAYMLYKVTTTGTVLESHACETQRPAGIVYDGTYLWYCDGPLGSNSTLYKVDLAGTGTPAITVPVTSHNYGNVTIGNSSTWNCQVQNTGTADLTITSIGIPSGQPITTSFVAPYTIIPGDSVDVPLTYTPITATPLNTQVTINSNDPLNPAVNVTLTGQGVYNGPHIFLQYTSHDWGNRRAGAYSRWYLPVTNDGNSTLTITALNMSDPHFIVDESVVLPIMIPSNTTIQIGIWFHPEEGIDYSGTLTIVSDAVGQNTVDIDLQGAGVDTQYPIGTPLWNYTITGGYDNSPKAITPIQDITGDGVDDVLVGSEDYYIRCFNGNASGQGDVLWATENYAGSVYQQNDLTTIADINGDGYRDVIAGTTGGDRSIVALSGKTGLQIWKHDTHEYGGGGWVYQVNAKYDYNNDGHPDVLACTGNDGNNTGPVRVYCLNGLTGISIWERRNPDSGPLFSVIGVEDFTGDGKPDVIAGGANQQETAGRIFGINGSTGIIEWTNYPTGTSVWGLMQLDDITNDGIKDIAAGDFGGMILLINAASGANVRNKNIGPNLILRLQDMGDINQDGYRDFLVAHSGTQGIMINGYTCDYIWTKPLADKSWNVANIGDVTWDGYNDAIIGTLFQSNFAYFLDGIDGTVLASTPVSAAVDALNAIPDIVGDSSMEMVLGNRNGLVACLSGGYDTSTMWIPSPWNESQQSRLVIYPNPMKEWLHIQLLLQESSQVRLELYDLTGRNVALILESTYPRGIHTISWNGQLTGGKRVNTGMYSLKATIGGELHSAKLLVE
ncbi:MAG: FG-GAP-like repeat-containing protein [Bacteroidota bacterium]